MLSVRSRQYPVYNGGKSVWFMGYQRQVKYLESFRGMDSSAQEALRDIYRQAHQDQQGDRHGRHIILAMRAAIRYPIIFKLTLSNILIRLSLKNAMVRQDTPQVNRLQEVLEDFHKALDAFMHPDKALQPQTDTACPREDLTSKLSILEHPEILDELRRFKQQATPSLERLKQANARKGRKRA